MFNPLKHKIVTYFTIVILIVITVCFNKLPFFFWVFVAIAIIYFIITSYGSFQIQFNYFINSINKGFNAGIVLSFDDGPDPDITPKILEILKTNGIKASYFVIGEKAEKHPLILKAIQEGGHIIANHSYGHNYSIGFFSTRELSIDIEKCSEIIEQITGKKTHFFRPPFGVTNPRYSTVLKRLKLTSIGWSGRSLDTITSNKDILFKRVKKSIGPGAILLFHDTQLVTLEALPNIIEYCKENGVKIVPLQELISQNPYEAD